ncbi:MAG: agmatine deiminase family protein [Limisphaera sp.]|nr:agmatine deiminase family protein [Limisphaera sp.]
MPAEWEPHQATWLAWPHLSSDWPGKLDAIRWVYTEIVRKLTEGEDVYMLVRDAKERAQARRYLARAGCNLARIRFVTHATNRSWTRDYGPIFVRCSSPPARLAIIQFHFNGWAKYKNYRKDQAVPETAAAILKLPLFRACRNHRPFVLEGGAIDVNGRGTVLTTEECLLHPRIQVRNPGWRKADYQQAFRSYLGAHNILWLKNGIIGDDTHGHVDDLARFINPRTLVMVREPNPRDPNHRRLEENWDRVPDLRLEDGTKPEVIPLPMPAPLLFDGYRLPASYANFYITNTAVLVPTFNDPKDRMALGILSDLFPDRPVVGIHAVDLVLGLGTLHCLTQQQPVGS